MAVGQRCYCNWGFLWIREEENLAAPNSFQILEMKIKKKKKERKKIRKKSSEGNLRAAVEQENSQ